MKKKNVPEKPRACPLNGDSHNYTFIQIHTPFTPQGQWPGQLGNALMPAQSKLVLACNCGFVKTVQIL